MQENTAFQFRRSQRKEPWKESSSYIESRAVPGIALPQGNAPVIMTQSKCQIKRPKPNKFKTKIANLMTNAII